MAEVIWIEGDTGDRLFVLSQDGVVVDLSGATVETVLRPAPRIGGALRFYPAVIVSAVDGKISWAASAASLSIAESPYFARFRVTLGALKSYFPYPYPDTWTVIE